MELHENDPTFVARPARQNAVHRTREGRLRDHILLSGDLTGKSFTLFLWSDLFDNDVPANVTGNGLILQTQDLVDWSRRIMNGVEVRRRAQTLS